MRDTKEIKIDFFKRVANSKNDFATLFIQFIVKK